MKLDLKSMLVIPKDIAAPLLSEAIANAKDDQAEWANYGRRIYQILHSEKFERELGAAVLWDSHAPNLAERLRGFLTKAGS